MAALAAALVLSCGQGASAQIDVDEPAASAPAADAGGAPSVPSASAEEEAPRQKNLLLFYYEALGLKYTIVFLGLSFTLVALIVMNFLALRRESIIPVTLVEAFEAFLNEKKYHEAYELAKSDESFLGKVLSAGLAKLSAGYPQAVEAMNEVGEDESMKLEHRLSYVALLASLAPMVGLLGTVDGMVAAFQTIAAATTAPKPDQLANDISMALVTTMLGLVLAIPAVAVFTILKNRMSRLVLEVGIMSEGLMSRFQTVGRKPA